MQEIIIDEHFKKLMPPLGEEAFAMLEMDIIEHGVLYPLVLWNGILIDGHNRYAISKKHNIPFETISMEFDAREKVLIWIITIQLAQRNLPPMLHSYYRGLHYNMEKQWHGHNNMYLQESIKSQTGTLSNEPPTAVRLAEIYNVSRNTIMRDSNLAIAIDAIGALSPEAKQIILSEQANISRTRLQELANATQEELLATIEMILDGTHQRRISRQNEEENEDTESDDDTDEKQAHSIDTYERASINSLIGKIATEVVGVQKISSQEKPEELKPALRALIDMLEELYNKI